MTYTLIILTLVGYTTHKEYDWRPLVEIRTHQSGSWTESDDKLTKKKCEDVAKSLDLKPSHYRCIRTE